MSQHFPALKPKAVIRALQRAGFFIHHTSGSHHILKHPSKAELRVNRALPQQGPEAQNAGVHHRAGRLYA